MKKHSLAGPVYAVLFVAFCTPSPSYGSDISASGGSARAQRGASTASILFMRTSHPTPQSSVNTVLFRVQPTGGAVTPLTPATDFVDYLGGSWSPGGGGVAYEKAPQWKPTQSQLFVVDRQGGPARRITSGPGLHTQASWGPAATITFFTTDSGHWCLGSVRANGTAQRILFCPCPTTSRYPDMFRSTPQWSSNGKSVYFEIADYGPDAATWHSRVYRVNVHSGTAVLLTEQVFGDLFDGGRPDELEISPNGKRGIYSTDRLEMIDLRTGVRTRLPIAGSSPLYSNDGQKIAFVQPGTGRVFVMNADGSKVRPVTAASGGAYVSVAGWSANGRRLLINQNGDERLLRMVELGTGKLTTLTTGTAAKGAWFHR